MQIRKLNASFGKLERETLKLHEGLNIIHAPNESGKSTWCAFIRAMLYGIDSSQRSHAGFLPDKHRYAPWSGAPMEGSMDILVDQQEITIIRSTKAKNAPMQEFSAVYTGTNTPLDGLNGTNCGEILTGVNREVFRRSAFIEQGTIAVTGNPELEKRINAIVSTGEESCSFSEAENRLRSWQRRRFNRRGLIPQLEGKMDDIQRRLSDMNLSAQDIDLLEDRLEESRLRCSELELQVAQARKKQRREALDNLRSGREALNLHAERHDAALSAAAACSEALRNGPFSEESLSQVESKVSQDLLALQELVLPSAKRLSPLLPLLFFICSALCAGLYSHFQQIVFIIFSVLSCLCAVVLFLRWSSHRNNARALQIRRQEILLKYKAGSSQDLEEALNIHRQLWDNVKKAERLEQESRFDYEQARLHLEALEAEALGDLDFSSGSSPAALLSRELSAQRQYTQKLSSQLSSLQGRLAATGDPLVLSSELRSLEEEYEQLNREYDAIALAADVLAQADEQLQLRFSPRLGRLAGEYMALVTGGRYSDVFINRDFSARLCLTGDSIPRESAYLSSGTLDLMYLALRLAVCELALPEGQSCPLILDDALVNLDEQRLSQAMDLLREIAKSRQVILFTCREIKHRDLPL